MKKKYKKFRKIYKIDLTETQLNSLLNYLGDVPADGNIQVGIIHPLFRVILKKKIKFDIKTLEDKEKRLKKLFGYKGYK
jgi:hypothetical protein